MSDNKLDTASHGSGLPPMREQERRYSDAHRSQAAIEAEKVIGPEVYRRANADAGAALKDILSKYDWKP